MSRLANFKKKGLFHLVKEMSISNQAWYGVSPGRLDSETKNNLRYSLPRKKVSFSYGNLGLFQISNFKNRSFLSVQEVVQIKLNLIWSIPCVGKA